MNKAELVSEVAVATENTKKLTDEIITATFDVIIKTLSKGEPVKLIGFGQFDTKEYAARLGRNPRTNEEVNIPAKRKPTFVAGKELRDAVAGE